MYKLILTTTDSIQTVNTISDYLLNTKLSPCVQILNNLDSEIPVIGEDELALLSKNFNIDIYIQTWKYTEANRSWRRLIC